MGLRESIFGKGEGSSRAVDASRSIIKNVSKEATRRVVLAPVSVRGMIGKRREVCE